MSETISGSQTYAVLKSLVGKEFPPYRWVIEEGKVREFCRATRDDDPRVESAAPPIPLTLSVSSVLWQGRDEKFYRSLGLDMRYVLHGEQEFEYLVPISVGQHLTAHLRLASVEHKAGKRGGEMILLTLETEFLDEDEKVVLRAFHRIIQTEKEVSVGE